MKTLKTIRS